MDYDLFWVFKNCIRTEKLTKIAIFNYFPLRPPLMVWIISALRIIFRIGACIVILTTCPKDVGIISKAPKQEKNANYASNVFVFRNYAQSSEMP